STSTLPSRFITKLTSTAPISSSSVAVMGKVRCLFSCRFRLRSNVLLLRVAGASLPGAAVAAMVTEVARARGMVLMVAGGWRPGPSDAVAAPSVTACRAVNDERHGYVATGWCLGPFGKGPVAQNSASRTRTVGHTGTDQRPELAMISKLPPRR